MKVTHIFVLCIEHHVIPYIKFIKEELNDPCFQTNIIVYSKQPTEQLSCLEDHQVKITPNRHDIVTTIKSAKDSHKVIIHGFYDSVIFLKLLFSHKPLTFVSWAMWGADVYFTPPKGIRGAIINYCRKKVIPRIGNKLGLRCDYTWLFQQLNVKDQGEFKEIGFPAWFYQDKEITLSPKINNINHNSKPSALIGNSADPTNNFIQLIDQLKHSTLFKKYTFVLNYGGSARYINEIKQHALANLANCELIFLTDKLAYQEYIELMACHDALIYNHDRQQGVGSLNIAFELGLAVFIPKENPMTSNYLNWNVKIFTTESISALTADDLQKKSYKEYNQQIIQGHYHPKKVAQKLISIIKEK